MYLKKSRNKKTGRTQLFIVEAYRDENKKPKSKVIKTLGYLDVLEKQYDDPIAYFSELAKKMTADRNEAMQRIRLLIDPNESMPSGCGKTICFGFAALIKMYNEFGIDELLSDSFENSKIYYNQNNIFKFAVCTKTLAPVPDISNISNAGLMLGLNRITPSDYYRTLDIIDKNKLDIIKRINEKYLRVCADITAKASDRISHTETDVRSVPLSSDFSELSSKVYCYFSGFDAEKRSISSCSALNEFFDPWQDLSLFYSIFTDERDFPLYYALISGSMSEAKARRTFLERFNKIAVKNHVIAVTGSLYSGFSNVKAHIYEQGNGYIFAYPASNAEDSLREFAANTDKSSLKTIRFEDTTVSLNADEHSKPFIDDLNQRTLLYCERVAVEKFLCNGKVSDIKEKQLLFYSPSFAAKTRFERSKLLEIAEEIIHDPGNLNRTHSYAAEKYINNLHNDSCRDNQGAAGLSLNTALIHEEERLDGYIVITTNEPELSVKAICSRLLELTYTDEFISHCYIPRFNSKESYTHPPENTEKIIQTDFFLKYIGLVLCRLIEQRLNKSYTLTQILDSLKKCEYIRIEDDIYMLNYRDKVLDDIGSAVNIDFSKRFRRIKEIKEFME